MKKHIKFILFFSILNVVMLAFDLFKYRDVLESHKNYFLIMVISQVAVELFLIAIYMKAKKKNMSIEKLFLLLFLPLGILHIIFTPLNFAPDEYSHIFRAYEISKGVTTPKYNNEGDAVSDFPSEGITALYLWQNDHSQFSRAASQINEPGSGETEEWKYTSAVSYPPISYLPQMIGLWVGRLLNMPIVAQLYLGRFCMLIVSAFFLYFAVKLMPKYKEFLVLIILLPRTIQSGVIFSGDGMLNATALLFIAYVLKLALDEDVKKVSIKQIVGLTVLVSVFSSIKQYAYFPICLLFFLIPNRKLGSKYKKPLFLIISLLATVVVGRIFAAGGPSVASSAGIMGLFNFNKIGLLLLSFGTFFGVDSVYLLEYFTGSILGMGGVKTATQFYSVFFIALVVVLLLRNVEKIKIKKSQRLLLWAVPIIMTMIFYYVAMTQWHTYQDKYRALEGVTGRYFIPLTLLIPFMIQPKKAYVKEKLNVDYIFLFSIFFNMAIVFAKIVYHL